LPRPPVVLEATYSPIDGSVESFAVNFRQYDETSTTEWTQLRQELGAFFLRQR
jgi:hypothetical protein